MEKNENDLLRSSQDHKGGPKYHIVKGTSAFNCFCKSNSLDDFLPSDDLHSDYCYGHWVIFKVRRKENVKS